jgi:molybdate-binding protein
VYAIEAGTYVPNTSVSLKLARVLETTVEEIFQLEKEDQPTDTTAEAMVLGDTESLQPGQPLRLCAVNEHLVAVSPELGQWGLPSTDAILLSTVCGERRKPKSKVRILGNGWKNPARIVIAGCDPSASILENSLQRQGCELVIAYENSSGALELLRDGFVHIAGTHLVDKVTGKTDLLPITNIFPRNSVAVFSYAMWQEGFVVAKNNPKKICGISDLARKDVRITNREHGAGCRRLLDDLLKENSISFNQVKGYDQATAGHIPAARLVQSGEVDCCVGTQAGARALGLDFVPLTQKPYHLVIRRKQLGLPPIQTLIETLGRSSFRREIEASVGYDMSTSGDRLI